MTQAKNSVTNKRDILARARPSLKGRESRCHGRDAYRDRDNDSHRDSDSAPLRSDTVTITVLGKPVVVDARRHAAWLAMMPTDPAGGREEDRRHAEQQELIARCADRILDNQAAGRGVDPHAAQWAEDFLRANPQRLAVLSSGEPATEAGDLA